MNNYRDHIADEEEEHVRHRASGGSEREITLGTTMILLLFFALAVYGAALFGFGYSLGSKHTVAGPSVLAATTTSGFNGAKPSPGSPIGSTGRGVAPTDTTPVLSSESEATVTRTVALDASVTDIPQKDIADKAAAGLTVPPADRPVARPTPSPTPSVSPVPVAIAPGALSLVVQVAAVSHQEDADMMAAALQHRGYAVSVRSEPDKLIHVQVGPFATRKDAEAMRTRLLADGFNAYIK